MGEDDFAEALATHGLSLDLKTQILFTETEVYCNGEPIGTEAEDTTLWRQLANQRQLPPAAYPADFIAGLYEGYLSGYWYAE